MKLAMLILISFIDMSWGGNMTLTEYQDSATMWHDRKCINGIPSSNNTWIYTAYSKYLAPKSFLRHEVMQRYLSCARSFDPLKIDRLPQMHTPPLSKDEVIGMVSLGLLTSKELENSHWNFCNLEAEFDRKLSLGSIYRGIKALWGIRGKHRNTVWAENVVEAYPLAFRLAPHDIYYVKRFYKRSTSLLEKAAFYANFASVYFRGDKSSRMLLWLQLEDMNHYLLKFIPKKKWVQTYFESEHPFHKAVE